METTILILILITIILLVVYYVGLVTLFLEGDYYMNKTLKTKTDFLNGLIPFHFWVEFIKRRLDELD